jgi:drug/metabolite transporter (DMT)-like permease
MWLAVCFLSVFVYKGECFRLLVGSKRKDPTLVYTPTEGDLSRVLLVGLVSGFVMPVAAIYGLQMTTPTTVAIYDGPLYPIFVFVLALCLGAERLSKISAVKQIFSVVLATLGALAVVLDSNSTAIREAAEEAATKQELVPQYVMGNLLLTVESIALAVGLVLQKPLLMKYPIANVSLWTWLVGASTTSIYMTATQPGGVYSAVTSLVQALQKSAIATQALLYVAVLHTSVSFLLSGYSNRVLSSSTVALFACTQPVLTALLEWLVLDKPMALQQLAGAAVITGAVCLNQACQAIPPHNYHGQQQPLRQAAGSRPAV